MTILIKFFQLLGIILLSLIIIAIIAIVAYIRCVKNLPRQCCKCGKELDKGSEFEGLGGYYCGECYKTDKEVI